MYLVIIFRVLKIMNFMFCHKSSISGSLVGCQIQEKLQRHQHTSCDISCLIVGNLGQ